MHELTAASDDSEASPSPDSAVAAAPPPAAAKGDGKLVALFAGVTFLGASLLFWVQPLLSKQLLPLLGGSPAVWNTSVFFFQTLLLAGYAWAHVIGRLRSTRLQAGLQVGLALVGLMFTLRINSSPTDSPIPWLLWTLLGAVGVPFFLLSSGAPLMQRWFSSVSTRDPYRLYVASNLGSFLALLAFPLVLEPLLPTALQVDLWRGTYFVFVALLALASFVVIRRAPARVSTAASSEEAAPAIAWKRRVRWLLLAAVPSSLSLGTTTYLTTDIAPVPLLWVVPLALYLLTFILAFGAKGGGAMPLLWPLFGILATLQIYTLVIDYPEALIATMLLHLMVLFLAARLCHGELAADRPSPARLTEFYLWLSAGGALGGLFNGVIAPLVFDSVAEYPIALFACLALAPGLTSRRMLRAAAAVGVIGLVGWLLLRNGLESVPFRQTAWAMLIYGLPAAGLVWGLVTRSVSIVARVAGPIVLASSIFGFGSIVFHERSFFAVHRVLDSTVEGTDYRILLHGRIIHGMQPVSDDPEERLRPIAYYHSRGPVGDVFRDLHARLDSAQVGIVGLGAGGLVAHGRGSDRFVFYEIDPLVVDMARDPEVFTYLSDARASVDVLVGDGRLLLEKEERVFDLLILDAFGSDGVPMHLLSLDALRDVYLPRLSEDGTILFHVSNRFLDVRRVAAGIGQAAGLQCWIGDGPLGKLDQETSRTLWVVLKRSGGPPAEELWQPCPDDGVVWTDDWSNLFQVFRPN